MRTHLEFRSDAFRAEPGEEEKINPERWGAALAGICGTTSRFKASS